MRCLLAPAGGLLLREAGLLLRRRSRSGPLLLLGVAVCLFYQTRSGPQPADPRCASEDLQETRRLISALEVSGRQVWSQPPPRRRAVVLTGRHLLWDTEVQLYQQVLQQMDYEVQLSRYAETSSFLRTNHVSQ
ncbi:hypothetical protein L3Q82_000433 [Scortum barcoo]|uniref:Uncharacterized protein n=1 Tax=Scortum barcoo TaxID=214431 RepID=A0ACB8WF60_9TELE|nr:hypothetical protein L3Q82_000433 [Scortum barcoo]